MKEEQKKEIVKKTKIKMWAGLVSIILIGLIISVYFVFLKEATEESTTLSNWKTYTNEIHGYSFQYPGNVNIVSDIPKRDIDMKGPELASGHAWPRLYIANYPGDDYRPPEGTDLRTWITEKLEYETFAEDRTIAGETAVHLDDVVNTYGDIIDRYYFLKNGQIYQVDILHTDGLSDWNIYNKFLDSIVFTDDMVEETEDSLFNAVDTTGWLTYSDEIHSYSIKYPSDYLIKEELDGYVTFDSSLIDSPDNSHLHFVIETRDVDEYTFRISLLTNAEVSSDFEPIIEDITIDGLPGIKITYKNQLGETIIHHLVNYLGKTYDIRSGDSLSEDIRDAILNNFSIDQFDANVDITDTSLFRGKECVSHSECGAYPCNPSNGKCLVQNCTDESSCPVGVCGLHVTPVPGYCTTIDVL